MNINDAFLQLVKNNEFDFTKADVTIKSICKKLNSVYYGNSNETDHLIIAGSAGRGTFIKGSDIDCCFVLPNDVYERFRNRKWNIQSQLLSEISSRVKERYPNSDITADGQVVDASFSNILIEIVPCFLLNSFDEELLYPNSHNDGTWLTTNPIKQKNKIKAFNVLYPSYVSLCKIIRCWKTENNVNISGIIIDSLMYQFLEKQYDQSYKEKPDNFDFLGKIKEFFDYLSSPSCPEYVQIIGESSCKKTQKERFIKKAKKAYKRMSTPDMCKLWDNLIYLFGNGFPDNPSEKVKNDGEMFIQDLFPIKITGKLTIDCDISNNGYRTFSILDYLSKEVKIPYFVPKHMSLDFFIKECDVQRPYKIYWKVRNVGKEARGRNDIRGQIVLGGTHHKEKSTFYGPHYVECYIVKNGVCVARNKISVPIEL